MSVMDGKDVIDSPLESAREVDEGGKRMKSKDAKLAGLEESLLPLDDLERELVSQSYTHKSKRVFFFTVNALL